MFSKGEYFMNAFIGIMETMMLILFGISWPLNIVKAWRARTAQGMSLLFYSFIWLGYVFALVGKFALIHSNAPQPWYESVHWYVMFCYILNILMVSIGILVYFRDRYFDKKINTTNAVMAVCEER